MAVEIRGRTEADLEQLAELLDSKFHGPFGTKFGWDGLLGLIPGVGDMMTSLASTYIVARAAMLGVSFSVLLRMVGNVLIDNVIDLVPFFGWIGDFAWKSNLKNLELLRRHAENPAEVARRSRIVVFVSVTLLIVFMIGLAVLTGWLAWWILSSLMGFVRESGHTY